MFKFIIFIKFIKFLNLFIYVKNSLPALIHQNKSLMSIRQIETSSDPVARYYPVLEKATLLTIKY